jgi:lysophospholipase L1-like esterase
VVRRLEDEMKGGLRLVWASAVAALWCAVPAGAIAAESFALRDGDRVVFLGDSITEQGCYATYVEAFALTRFPAWKLSFRNVGLGGESSWMRRRSNPAEPRQFDQQLIAASAPERARTIDAAVHRALDRDVLPLRPSFVVVSFGMNDHGYEAFRDDRYQTYLIAEATLASALASSGARVALVTSQPIEEKTMAPDRDPRNQALKTFASGLRGVAGKEGALFVDEFNPYMDVLLQSRTRESAATIGGGDPVHPGGPGCLLMGWTLLKAFDAPGEVSRVEIDARAAQVVDAAHTRVSNLEVRDGGLRFDRLDAALPMPWDARSTPALHLAPIVEELDRYELRIRGLREGSYELVIDGEPVTRVDARELERGINLATGAGPITRQSRQVLELVTEKNSLFANRWRPIELLGSSDRFQGPEAGRRRTEEVEQLDARIAALEVHIDEVRKPVVRRFELRPYAP